MQSDASLHGQIYAHFDQPFPSFVVPPGQTVNSGVFGGVILTQGALASLGIIPAGILDVAAAATVHVGEGGYEIPWLHLSQQGVPTTYQIELLAQQKIQQLSSASPAGTTA